MPKTHCIVFNFNHKDNSTSIIQLKFTKNKNTLELLTMNVESNANKRRTENYVFTIDNFSNKEQFSIIKNRLTEVVFNIEARG